MENTKPRKEKIIKGTWNIFRLEKEAKAITDRIPRNIKNLFEHEK